MDNAIKGSTEDYIRELERTAEGRRPVEVAVLRLNDPDNHNALSGPLTVELRRKLAAVCTDSDVRVIVLTGEGRFFSVGGDWKLMVERALTYTERAEGSAKALD